MNSKSVREGDTESETIVVMEGGGGKKKKRPNSKCYGIIKHLGLAGGKGWLGMAYLLAAVEIHQENRAAFTF